MGFEKGHKKYGGRKKGVKNKNTRYIEYIERVFEEGIERYIEALKNLDDEKYVLHFAKLIDYVAPKMARQEIDISVKDTGPKLDLSKLSVEDLEKYVELEERALLPEPED